MSFDHSLKFCGLAQTSAIQTSVLLANFRDKTYNNSRIRLFSDSLLYSSTNWASPSLSGVLYTLDLFPRRLTSQILRVRTDAVFFRLVLLPRILHSIFALQNVLLCDLMMLRSSFPMNLPVRSITAMVLPRNEIRDSFDEGCESGGLAVGKGVLQATAAVLVKCLDIPTHHQ